MELFEAIHTRRSIGTVKPDPPPRELIEKILGAAIRAPNHYHVEPWRFFVVSGDALNALAEIDAELKVEFLPKDTPESVRKQVREKQRGKVLRAPYIIVCAVAKPSFGKDDRPKREVVPIENVAATAAAIQNMLLAAHALGLGAKWRTGPLAYHPKTKAFFGLEPDDDLLGFIYVGYPDEDPELTPRRPVQEKTVWMGSPEETR